MPKKGFTLLELLVACFILVFALGSILVMFLNNAFLIENARSTTVALNDCQTVLEEIRRVSISSLGEVTSTDWTSWANNNNLNTLNEESIQVSFANPSSDPLEITVTVNWKDRTRSRTLKLMQEVTTR